MKTVYQGRDAVRQIRTNGFVAEIVTETICRYS
jgi:hypothetical protein